MCIIRTISKLTLPQSQKQTSSHSQSTSKATNEATSTLKTQATTMLCRSGEDAAAITWIYMRTRHHTHRYTAVAVTLSDLKMKLRFSRLFGFLWRESKKWRLFCCRLVFMCSLMRLKPVTFWLHQHFTVQLHGVWIKEKHANHLTDTWNHLGSFISAACTEGVVGFHKWRRFIQTAGPIILCMCEHHIYISAI